MLAHLRDHCSKYLAMQVQMQIKLVCPVGGWGGRGWVHDLYKLLIRVS
jgi:hypothetical protein